MATHRWTTDNEIEFAESFFRKNRAGFLLYAAEIERRKKWGEMDPGRIKAFVGILRSSPPQVRESVSA